MKLSILQENLAHGVTAVSRAVAAKAQLPVLANILLATEGGKLKLSATNLETGITVWLNAKVERAGKVTVPGRVFGELVTSLPQEAVELTVSEEKVQVKSGAYRATVNGISAEEFPEVPTLAGKKAAGELGLDGAALSEAVSLVAFAAGTDEARPIFTGVKMEFSKKGLRLAATDGYRLSVKSLPGSKIKGAGKEMVVPARALTELTKMLKDEEGEEVRLAATDKEKQLIMSLDGVEVVTRLLEGDFPDFDKIVPGSSKTKLELETEELHQAVRAAAIFARDSANIVKFKIEKDKLTVTANAPQVGENEIGVAIKKTGEDSEVAFNSRYLLEMLSAVTAERVGLELSGPLSPGMFRAAGDDSWLHIIMPVRVQG